MSRLSFIFCIRAVFFLSLLLVRLFIFRSFLPNQRELRARERETREKSKSDRLVLYFRYFVFGSAKNQFQKTVLCVETAILFSFSFFPSVTRILCLFQIVLYYLFIFDFVLWRRTREHLLLKCVHSVAACFFFSCEFRVRMWCWFFWLNGCYGREAHTSQNVRHDGHAIISVLYARARAFFSFSLSSSFDLWVWCDRRRQRATNRTHELRFVFHFSIFMYGRGRASAIKQNQKSQNYFMLKSTARESEEKYGRKKHALVWNDRNRNRRLEWKGITNWKRCISS